MAHELEFTAASFLRIATVEARRGRDDPGQQFPAVNQIISKLKDVHLERRQACAPLWKTDDAMAHETYASYRPKIAELQNAKRAALETELQKLSARLSSALKNTGFAWGLGLGAAVGTRQTYRVATDPDRYFAMKQLEINLKNAHRLRPPHRNRVVAQLRDSLEGKLPRYVLRTDITSFYESVPHATLLGHLRAEGGLSKTSLSLIQQLLDEWVALTGRDAGLPTGVGISAYLGEVFARQIDDALSGDPAVHFYGRYADDIVVVTRTTQERDAVEQSLDGAVRSLGLKLNPGKTLKCDPLAWAGNANKDPFDIVGPIDFLGYAISKSDGIVVVNMSSRTVDRYKLRLKLAFDRWAATIARSAGHESLVLDRIRFLTGNTKLMNSKGRAVTGIYFNYPVLTAGCPALALLDSDLSSLEHFDTATAAGRPTPESDFSIRIQSPAFPSIQSASA